MCCNKKKAPGAYERLNELKIMELINKKEQQKKAEKKALIRKICLIVTGLAALAAIAYAAYKYFKPEYADEFDDFDDEFEDIDLDDAEAAVEITIEDVVEE